MTRHHDEYHVRACVVCVADQRAKSGRMLMLVLTLMLMPLVVLTHVVGCPWCVLCVG